MSSLSISAAELTERLGKGEKPVIIDVREQIEYHTYNIGGANIPLSVLPGKVDDFGYNKTDELIVICKAGIRSRTAQAILQQHGYQNVKNLTGGLIAIQKLL
ncbi:rhodanese-like domain-containing protein [Mucilaginibacter hurinus]|uniref:Rhodanese-like domain-containing protein n=1 Tax=Mucilaginibacter hurinus TaxID=2201324 RepID=A0A367GKH5_9SPHI|nr:rhodanese-like domain-containing protein [Mucilaginibacter hurinus]RCH53969.1 rhodanese-like domain-containing protein [Mucilaginibacter hurinus]